jgi:hypothetical protein
MNELIVLVFVAGMATAATIIAVIQSMIRRGGE